MTIPKRAIELAIEGGWSDGKHLVEINGKWGIRLLAASGYAQWEFKFEEIALDPAFFQALGKALGWDDYIGAVHYDLETPHSWHFYALNFYDLILTGDDTEKFWDDLLSNKQ